MPVGERQKQLEEEIPRLEAEIDLLEVKRVVPGSGNE
jgi:hypothetical protein